MPKVIPALLPVPVVLVSAAAAGHRPNLITVAWTGIVNSEPPMVYAGIRPSRHSHAIIEKSGEYVINIPSAEQAGVVDYCGTVSGRDVDKFRETGLTAAKGTLEYAPLVREFPVNLECRVVRRVALPSHDVFIGEITAVHVNADVLDAKGRPDIDRMGPYAFCLQQYRAVRERIGGYGYTKKTKV